MEDPKQLLSEMGFTQEQITQAINQTNSSDIGVLITYLENMNNEQQQQPQQQPENQISKYVKEEDVAILMSEGYSKNVAEKSLLLTKNKGVEVAKQWIEEHKDDQDFQEELQVVAVEEGKKMSPEEAAFRARELQQKLREKRRIEEEQAAIEQEKNRVKSGKAMNDVRRELEEQKKKQEALQAKREREQFLKAKFEMEEQLRREKEARFGKSYSSNTTNKQQQQQKTYQPIELFEVGIKQIKVAQPNDLLPDVAFNSLTLISKILENIIKNPNEPKFRKISLTSQAYQTKIEQVFGAREALDSVGFIEKDGFYMNETQDIQLLQKALTLVQNELK